MIPPVIWREVKNANARNHMFFIEIEPDRPFATLAQEVAEWQYKAALFVPTGIIGALIGAVGGWQIIGTFTAMLFGALGLLAGATLGNNYRSGSREIEYWGRAVDVAAGGDISRLVRELAGYGQFRGRVAEDDIRDAILDRLPEAERWLDRNEAELELIYAERYL